MLCRRGGEGCKGLTENTKKGKKTNKKHEGVRAKKKKKKNATIRKGRKQYNITLHRFASLNGIKTKCLKGCKMASEGHKVKTG